MATQPEKPKGILKKPSSASAQAAGSAVPPPPDARQVAVQHAQIIHQRRELEDHVSDSIISLARYPLRREAPHEACCPAASDAAAFKALVRVFQPGDYDDLVDERNANGLCGYALCARARRRIVQAGEYKLVNYGRKDFSIMPKKELEKWCSLPCARRAMYVKVQLNETAAWERVGIPSIQIDLLDEPREPPEQDAASGIAADLNRLDINSEKRSLQRSTDLALERGRIGAEALGHSDNVDIREKPVAPAAQAPFPAPDEDGHLVLDGYKTNFGKSRSMASDD